MNLYEFAKWASSVIIGFAICFTNQYGNLILLIALAVLIDIITGLIKGKVNKEINSQAGYIGFWKKLSLFAGLGFGIFLDAVVGYSFVLYQDGNTSLSLARNIPFGNIIGIYIILNESISIVENLHACGVKIPLYIFNILHVAKDEIDKGTKNKKR